MILDVVIGHLDSELGDRKGNLLRKSSFLVSQEYVINIWIINKFFIGFNQISFFENYQEKI